MKNNPVVKLPVKIHYHSATYYISFHNVSYHPHLTYGKSTL